VSWAIHFRTKAKLGNHILSRQVRFVDGGLTIRDNEFQAHEVLSRADRGIEWEVNRVEGEIPGHLMTLVRNSPLGKFSRDFPSTMRPEEMQESVAGSEPARQHGVEVVEGQDEMPSDAETDALVGEKPEQEDIPDVNVENVDDLFLLDRAGLEAFAKKHKLIDAPDDFRNDDLLIEAIIAALEARGLMEDGVIVEPSDKPAEDTVEPVAEETEVVDEPKKVEIDVPSKSALKRKSRTDLEKYVRKLNKIEGVDLGDPKKYPNKGSIVEAVLKLKG